MGYLAINSIVCLRNGKELQCSNTVEEITKDLEESGFVQLILSKQSGEKLTVGKYQVVNCVPFD